MFLPIIIILLAFGVSSAYAADESLGAEKMNNFLSATDVVLHPELEEVIYRGIANFEKSIDISEFNIPINEGGALIRNCYSNVRDDNPELFFLGTQYYLSLGKTCYSKIIPTYTMTSEEAAGKMKEIEAEYQNILNYLRYDMSPVEKMLAVYDYFCTHYEYDYENYVAHTVPEVSYTILGVMLNKIGVCQAYSLAYELVLTRLGIECTTVTSESMSHMWNLVKIGESWYHVDVTWGDHPYDVCGNIDHTYFLVSDDTMMDEEHLHSGWSTSVTCGDPSYEDEIWVLSESAVAFDAENMYVALKNGNIKACDRKNGEESTVYSVNDVWLDAEQNAYTDKFVRIALLGGRLFFNTPSDIRSVRTDGSSIKTEHVPEAEGAIFGFYENEGLIYYVTAEAFEGYMPSNGSFEADIELVMGDCNGNGHVDIADAVLLAQYLADWDILMSERQKAIWDIEPDGVINIRDAVLLSQYLADWSVKLGAAQQSKKETR